MIRIKWQSLARYLSLKTNEKPIGCKKKKKCDVLVVTINRNNFFIINIYIVHFFLVA